MNTDTRSRRIASHSHQSVNGLLLGWETKHALHGFGFSRPAGLEVTPASITYKGDGHLLTVAPTGAGKGRGVIFPTILTFPGSVIVIDLRGENYQITAYRRRQLGQRAVVLAPFHLVNEEGDCPTPFDLYDLPDREAEVDGNVGVPLGGRPRTDTGTGLTAGADCPRRIHRIRSYPVV